jgi:hypothetical protein
MVNLARSRNSAHRQIRRWGGGPGALVRNGVSRPAFMGIGDYRPTEKGMFADKSVRILISTRGLTEPPLYDQDLIEFKGKQYAILVPPAGPRPDGSAVFYDCNCAYVKDL